MSVKVSINVALNIPATLWAGSNRLFYTAWKDADNYSPFKATMQLTWLAASMHDICDVT